MLLLYILQKYYLSKGFSPHEYNKVKVKQALYRPGQALRVPGGWGSQISQQQTHDSGKVVSLMHRLPLPPRKYSWNQFLLEANQTQGHTVAGRMPLKNSCDNHRELNPRPSRLQCSASTDCATVCPPSQEHTMYNSETEWFYGFEATGEIPTVGIWVGNDIQKQIALSTGTAPKLNIKISLAAT
jgi:hypothetical protein